MPNVVRGSNNLSIKLRLEQDGYITTLRPEGSANNIQVIEKQRELIRPKICYWRVALNIFAPIILYFIVLWWNDCLAIIGLCVYTLLRLQGIAIWLVKLYQRYASDELRLSCVFEPSCSEYMILSIQKHGAIRGCMKGIKRLKRCRHPNGGYDYP